MLQIKATNKSFDIYFDNKKLISHHIELPFLYLGKGKEKMNMYRGNFNIEDYVIERIGLVNFKIEKYNNNNSYIYFFIEEKRVLTLSLNVINGSFSINFKCYDKLFNRFWIRLNASKEEKVYGCGEQMSYFNLRGRNFPLWTSEPGVGRDKSTYVTWLADIKDKAGGDYYNTNYPQSTFISTKKYFCHVDSTAYMDFNFKNDNFHELQCWKIPNKIVFQVANTYLKLVSKVSAFFGHTQPLPTWVYNGIILGIQDGTNVVIKKAQKAIDHGVKVSGIWAQDWQGERKTSFGKRLNWNWKWNKKLYPNLDKEILNLKSKGIRFLGYINPYLIKGGSLYEEALKLGYFATHINGDEYTVDFGEFYCGVVDFTNPKAYEWYKRVIRKELIDFGLSGWMADFGEYLPIDCKLYNNIDAKLMHNDWPRLWAKVNFDAVKESPQKGEILYFMRAGFNGFQPYNGLLWAGDQCVDFSLHDGLASVIPAALSSGVSGMGLHHSDIGGYTTLHGLKRNKELFMRWVEMATFTPVMRTHEGNRPKDNFQFDQDSKVLKHLAKMVNIYVMLKPYIKNLVQLNSKKGIPVQRPLFMHYEDDEITYDLQYQYLFGEDILVAPVYLEKQNQWNVYLPKDQWIHLFSNESYEGGKWFKIDAPLGNPCVFYRKNSTYKDLFTKISSQI